MDSSFQKSTDTSDMKKLEEYKVFEKLAEIIFELLFPNERTRSWKSRVRLAKSALNKSNYNFFMKIFSKSLINAHDPTKTLKIKKVGKSLKSNKISPLHGK